MVAASQESWLRNPLRAGNKRIGLKDATGEFPSFSGSPNHYGPEVASSFGPVNNPLARTL
jgi:hypothetical protein